MSAIKKSSSESGNTELIKREPIPTTPFMAVWTEKTGWIGVCGKYKLTDNYETKDELIQEVEKKSWDMIFNVMSMINMESKQYENLNQ